MTGDHDDLAERLGQELHRRATTVTVGEEPFDPLRPRRAWTADRSPRYRPVWAAAAAAAVALVTAGLRLQGPTLDAGARDPSRPVGTAPGPRPGFHGIIPTARQPTALRAAPAPGWVPDGYELWDLDAQVVPPLSTQQSFLAADRTPPRPTVGVSVLPDPDGDVAPPQHASAEAVTIRGTAGTQLRPGPAIVELFWKERGVAVEIVAWDADPEELRALVEQLTWQSPTDPMAGFAVPAGSRWRKDTERRSLSVTPQTITRAVYGRADGARLSVVSMSLRPPEGTKPTDRRRADGSIVGRDLLGGVYVAWDDGRMVTVTAAGPPAAVDEATAERIADGVGVVDADRLRQLRAPASARLAAHPAVATAVTGAGQVSLIRLPGDAGQFGGGLPVHALCLQPAAGGDQVCSLDEAGAPGAYAGLLVDGRWWAVLAVPATDPEHRFVDDGGAHVDWTAPAGEQVDGAGWRFRVAEVPAGVPHIDVKRTTPFADSTSRAPSGPGDTPTLESRPRL